MAGPSTDIKAHTHGGVAFDPALLKWADMHKNRPKYFKWTARTAKISFMYMIAFPTFIGALAYWSEGRWELRGKRRGDIASEF